MISRSTIDRVFESARVEEVIGEFVQLKRAGSNLKGLSPFTDEKTPSFVVSPAKQIFKCFSTGTGGTVVTFLMEKEHFSYPEALRWLADKYGIEIPEARKQTKEELEKAGKTYLGKWFKPFQQEGYAASQSDHSSPTAKLTSSYLHPQVRRHGLVRRRTWCVHLHSHARETPAERLKARAATRPQLPKHKKKSTRILSRKRKK